MRHYLPVKPIYTTFWRLPLALAITTILLDQFTKWLVVTYLTEGRSTPIIPGFLNLVHFRNSGAAWGIMANHTSLLSFISVAVLLILALGFDRVTESIPERCLAIGFVTGGIAGNLIDRILWGEVIDFIDVFLSRYHWPAFNVADSAITCGVIAFILSTFFQHEATESKPGTEEESSISS